MDKIVSNVSYLDLLPDHFSEVSITLETMDRICNDIRKQKQSNEQTFLEQTSKLININKFKE